jgi:hypothetical protein
MPADHAHQVPTFDIGGLRIHVYGLRELPPNTDTAEVTVCFFTHGRMGSTAQLHGVISRFHTMAQAQMDAPLLVVAFDHRNHGTRLVSSFGRAVRHVCLRADRTDPESWLAGALEQVQQRRRRPYESHARAGHVQYSK